MQSSLYYNLIFACMYYLNIEKLEYVFNTIALKCFNLESKVVCNSVDNLIV